MPAYVIFQLIFFMFDTTDLNMNPLCKKFQISGHPVYLIQQTGYTEETKQQCSEIYFARHSFKKE